MRGGEGGLEAAFSGAVGSWRLPVMIVSEEVSHPPHISPFL